jgi:uncharacterized phage-associated protein
MYKAIEVAKYAAVFCTELGRPVTNLKLQALLYLIQGHYLEKKSDSIIEEDFYAWKIGPVIPVAYIEFQKYAAQDIELEGQEAQNKNICEEDKEYIESIVERYIDSTVWELVEIVNVGPCSTVYKMYGPNSKIPRELIKKYFSFNNR